MDARPGTGEDDMSKNGVRLDIRFRLTPTERVQWETDTDWISYRLGHHLPYKHIVLMAVNVLAKVIDYLGLLDRLDQLDLVTLINGTTKEKDE